MRNTKKLLDKMQVEVNAGRYTAAVYSFGVWTAGLIVCVELRANVDGKNVTKYAIFSARGYGKLHDAPRHYDGRMLEKHNIYYRRVLDIINDGPTLSRYISF